MGMLDGLMPGAGGQRGRPGLGSTVAAGVALALLVKAVKAHQNAQAGAMPGETRQTGGMLGGLGSMLGAGVGSGGVGSMLGGAGGGLGSILGGLGGAGALGGLLGQLKAGGLGQQANSWIGTGANQPVAPQQLEQALGPDAIDQLQQQTGMPRNQLMAQLAEHLPDAINQATPGGALPMDDDELHQIAIQAPTTH